MNRTYIRMFFHPKLEKPMLIVGFPGIGNIGKTVAKLLIQFSRAKLFAELYSSSFPDYVFIDKKGVCLPPRYEFYASTAGRNLVILTGDGQPALEDIPAHYEVCGDVLDFVSKLGCKFIIVIEGFPSLHPTKDIYVAATSNKQAKEFTEKNALVYQGGRIVGPSGLLLGLAKEHGLKGVCLLGSTLGLTVDQETAFNVYKFLRKVLGTEIQEGL